jgi:hypothetical protein
MSIDLKSRAEQIVKQIRIILLDEGKIAQDSARELLTQRKNYNTLNLRNRTINSVKGLDLSFGNNLDYANTIETGKANPANYDNILSWLNRKIVLGHIPKPENPRMMAAMITRKINRTGKIKSWKPFMLPTWKKALVNIDKRVKAIDG